MYLLLAKHLQNYMKVEITQEVNIEIKSKKIKVKYMILQSTSINLGTSGKNNYKQFWMKHKKKPKNNI